MIFDSPYEAYKQVPASAWKDWRTAGVQFSSFHKEGTPFALPFRPDSYLWAGPFTFNVLPEHRQQGKDFRLGFYRRGVKKYANMLAKGTPVPPVAYVYGDAFGWSMQDGNHRYEAVVASGASTFEAFLGVPKKTAKEIVDSLLEN